MNHERETRARDKNLGIMRTHNVWGAERNKLRTAPWGAWNEWAEKEEPTKEQGSPGSNKENLASK